MTVIDHTTGEHYTLPDALDYLETEEAALMAELDYTESVADFAGSLDWDRCASIGARFL